MKRENEPVKLPRKGQVIRDLFGQVIGVVIKGDGSWDFTRDGQDFLSGKRPLEKEKHDNNKPK